MTHLSAMSKRSINDLAVFGGAPLFATPRPIGQLYAPPFEKFRAALREIYDQRWLSNDGPMVRRLEETMAREHGVKHCIAVANAGLGLMMLLRILSKGEHAEVIMPAFSYRGLPHIAAWAGQIPRLCDVDPVTHTLDPKAVLANINESTRVILAVGTTYSPGHRDALWEIAKCNDVPLIFDSVNGFGSTYNGQVLGGCGIAEVFSLHATKLLNGFEGGYITTHDDDLARLLRVQRNFVLGEDAALGNAHPYAVGLNAKLNEIHAAMALSCLDDLQLMVQSNKERHDTYRATLAGVPGIDLVPYPNERLEASNYLLTVAEIQNTWPLTRDETVKLFRAEAMAVNPHLSPALYRAKHCPPQIRYGALPVAESLAKRYLQLPSGCFLSLQDIELIAGLCRFVATHGEEIAHRLRPELVHH